MNYAFQDREDLFLVCDLLTGGDLRFHIGKRKRFNEEQTSIFVFRFIILRIHGSMHGSGIRVHAQQWSDP